MNRQPNFVQCTYNIQILHLVASIIYLPPGSVAYQQLNSAFLQPGAFEKLQITTFLKVIWAAIT